jgi:hypothetical protein
MKLAAATFLLIVGIGLLVIAWREHAPQQQLPLVQASLPTHGFVCTPTITPSIGRVRTRNWT